MAYTTVGNKPQLIDIHVHGAETYDTRTRRQDDVLQIASLHGERGTSVILPTIYPGTIEAMRENMLAIRHAMAVSTFRGPHPGGPSRGPVPESRTGRLA